jgi:hypothetical protein
MARLLPPEEVASVLREALKYVSIRFLVRLLVWGYFPRTLLQRPTHTGSNAAVEFS